MFRKFLYWLSGKLPCRLIDIENKPYLERYYIGKIKRLGLTFYLHRFVSGDDERNVHDHPWPAASIILCGGYQEERLKHFDPVEGWASKNRTLKPWRVNFIKTSTFHRICKPKPETWTLFITGKRVKGWGFLFPPIHDQHCTAYNQPLDVSQSKGWYRTAPKGADIARESLKV